VSKDKNNRSLERWNRRRFLGVAASSGLAACAAPAGMTLNAAENSPSPGSQRLSLEQLRKWESLQYGMFICFGMSTFVQQEIPDGNTPAAVYAPDRLDVDQWVSVARDAGMKYIVLTTKHVAGHCLWPSKHTDYTVANGKDKTNVVEQFCKACEKRGVLPGLYYNSYDNHNRFGSKTPSDGGAWDGMNGFPKTQGTPAELPPFTTSLYQSFQTAQVRELLTQFGPIAETWIDIPGLLGRSYRTFLYNHIAQLQPGTVIMMNNGTDANYNVAYAWPSDLISLERGVPPAMGHERWREIEGKKYYMPGEANDPIGKDWFWVEGDKPRSDKALAKQFQACRAGQVNLVLSAPPDRHGLIPEATIAALMRLKKHANI